MALEPQQHLDEHDPSDTCFTFDYQPLDDVDAGQRWSTWLSVEPLCRGPEPRPDWVVTSQAAIDTELGVLKTGKEADAFLLERSVPAGHRAGAAPRYEPGDGAGDASGPGQSVVMVAKRYRGEDHRSFHRSSAYTEGRRERSSRDARAMAKRTTHGRAVAAGKWAAAEWQSLVRCHELGLAVPYPVQIDGTEILMQWITVDGEDGPETAPRLAGTRPGPALLASYFDQVREFLADLVGCGLVHGDLSAYNILAAGERLVVIDLPQTVDLVGNPAGLDFLLRDCTNVCSWFGSRGLEVDEQRLFGDLMAHAF